MSGTAEPLPLALQIGAVGRPILQDPRLAVAQNVEMMGRDVQARIRQHPAHADHHVVDCLPPTGFGDPWHLRGRHAEQGADGGELPRRLRDRQAYALDVDVGVGGPLAGQPVGDDKEPVAL